MIVYLITNLVSGKQYVGKTLQTLKQRWDKHNVNDNCPAMAAAIKKYSRDLFKVETLHICETKEEMDFVEMFYISLLSTKAPNGYNLTDGGDGNVGYVHSEEIRKKIREKAKGRVVSEETRRKMSTAHKGQRRSEEQRRNISLSKMGNKSTLGRKMPEDTKRKIAFSNTGKSRPYMIARNKTPEMRAAASKLKPRKKREIQCLTTSL